MKDKPPTPDESIEYLRAKLAEAYESGKRTEYMKHLAAVLLEAERAVRLERENESLASYAYNVTHGNYVALGGVETQLELLAGRIREIKNGYSGREK